MEISFHAANRPTRPTAKRTIPANAEYGSITTMGVRKPGKSRAVKKSSPALSLASTVNRVSRPSGATRSPRSSSGRRLEPAAEIEG